MAAIAEPAAAVHRPVSERSRFRRQAPKLLAADAFDRLPNALMVCDRDGHVVAANARLRHELGAGAEAGASCCSLLGCGRAGSELEEDCITARALDCGEALPEIHVDVPALGRVRVTTALLYGELSHVVIELRPERGRPATQQTLRIFTLGPLRVEAADQELRGPWLDQRAGQLLRYLACERRRVAPADAIAEGIWPQAGPAAANSVRHFVHVLRERLEPQRQRRTESSYVVCRRGGYALASGRVWIDADEFESEAAHGLAALRAGDVRAAEPRLVRATQLYAGDFLADEPYAEWALAERERLRALACNSLRSLADIRGEGADGAACLERLADMEPFDTDVQRRLITSWLQQGRRSRAARHYDTFRWRLLREFGEHPGFELADLAARTG